MIFLAAWGVVLVCGGLAVGGDVGLRGAGFGGCFLVIALVGHLRRPTQQRAAEARRAGLAVLPPEYHPRPERAALWVAAFGTTIAATFVGASISRLASGLSAVAVAAIWAAVVLIRERSHHRRVISSVQRGAEAMSPQELKRLVDTLEAVYTPHQMQTLRRLVRPDPAP